MSFKVLFKKGKGASGADLLSLQGSLDIQHIKEIKKSLEQYLKNCNGLEVEVQKAEKLDLTFLQLLVALKKVFESEEKSICFNLQLNEESERLLSGSGFAGYLHSKF